jgi:hypothetical protein
VFFCSASPNFGLLGGLLLLFASGFLLPVAVGFSPVAGAVGKLGFAGGGEGLPVTAIRGSPVTAPVGLPVTALAVSLDPLGAPVTASAAGWPVTAGDRFGPGFCAVRLEG